MIGDGEAAEFQHAQECAVEQHGDRGIDAGFQQIERQEHCGQQRHDLGAGNAHVKRRDQIVPEQHADGHDRHAAHETERGAVNIAALFVDDRSGACKCRTCDDIHDHADQTGRADEQLQQARHDAAGECGERTVEESGEREEDILRLIAQKADDRDLDKEHGDIADRAQQRKNGQSDNGRGLLRSSQRGSSSGGSFHVNLSFLTEDQRLLAEENRP